MSRDTVIEYAESLFWTVSVAGLSAYVATDDTIDAFRVAGVSAGLRWVLMLGQQRLSVLPKPGAGVPVVKALQRQKPATHAELEALKGIPDDVLNGLLK